MTRSIGIAILLAGLASLMFCGCSAPCKRLGDARINGARIITSVCPREALPRVCRRPWQNSNACAWVKKHRNGRIKTCWKFLANDFDGAKADPHETAHCGGADEGEARCADWPGTKAPKGQECRK